MQPPQGSYPQGGNQNGMGSGPSMWDQPPMLNQWVQRPVPGQQNNAGPMPGAAPPPAQIAPDPSMQPPYYVSGGQAMPGAETGSIPQPGNPGYYEDTPPASSGMPAPSTGYQMPKTGVPRPRRSGPKWWLAVLIIAGLAAGGFFIWRMLTPGQTQYGIVQYSSMSASYTGDAVLVRNETVDVQENVSQIDYLVDEGSRVKRGDMVATIYTSGFSAKEWTTLKRYRDQIKDYHKLLIDGATSDTTILNLRTQVLSRAMEVQRLVQGAQGSVSAQEKLLKEAMERQQLYIKQKYPDEQKLSRLYDDENTQLQRISTWTKQFAAPADGLVSFYTDGFEKALNMNTYTDYSPTQVRAMYNGQVPTLETSVTSRNAVDVYRLVREDKWVVLALLHKQDRTPLNGQSLNLVIESFDNHPLPVTVIDSARSGGELLVRLEVNDVSFLPNLMYLRQCQIRLNENMSSLTVPANAIYVQNGRKGVVISTEGGEYWTGVEELSISDDGAYAYVIPDKPEVVYEGVRVRLF
ncbi:MAG: hypothetical protein IJI53_06855 [Clostridia bacterium]|nr:hypothetical protein [Clostridia bacterium]